MWREGSSDGGGGDVSSAFQHFLEFSEFAGCCFSFFCAHAGSDPPLFSPFHLQKHPSLSLASRLNQVVVPPHPPTPPSACCWPFIASRLWRSRATAALFNEHPENVSPVGRVAQPPPHALLRLQLFYARSESLFCPSLGNHQLFRSFSDCPDLRSGLRLRAAA